MLIKVLCSCENAYPKSFLTQQQTRFQVLPMKTIAPFPLSQLLFCYRLPFLASFETLRGRASFLKVNIDVKWKILHSFWDPVTFLKQMIKIYHHACFGAGYGALTTVIPCQMARLDFFPLLLKT